MEIATLKDDVQTWLFFVELSFGYGNHITAARIHAIRKMVKWRTENFHLLPDEYQYRVVVIALYRLLGHATDNTAAEMQIYLHLFVDGCTALLKHIDTPAGELSLLFDKVPYWRQKAVEAATQERVAKIGIAFGDGIRGFDVPDTDESNGFRNATFPGNLAPDAS